MSDFGKLKLKKTNSNPRFRDSILFILIFVLCIVTVVTIQIRSKDKKGSDMTNSQKVQSSDVKMQTEKSEEVVNNTINDYSQSLEVQKRAKESLDKSADDKEVSNGSKENDITIKTDGKISENKETQKNNFNFIKPIKGDVIKAFSNEDLIYSVTMDDWRTHLGVDIKANIGTDVVAVEDGVVDDIYVDEEYGNTIRIKHSENLYSIYSNLSKNYSVVKGDKVLKGAVIAIVGDSSYYEILDEPHLHFAMSENGVYIEPLKYIEF